MKVKVLGSVSPYPRDNKNGVGYLITTDVDENKILLDCGPGSSRLLNMEKDLNNLTIIISHLHKDHYADLLSMGYASYVYHKLGYLKDRVKVYIPSEETSNEYVTGKWQQYAPSKKVLPDFEYLMNFGNEHFMEFIPYDEKTKMGTDMLDILTYKAKHDINTYHFRIWEKATNNVMVYSADTGYENNNLLRFYNGASLLICESTFLKGQVKGLDNHLYAYEAGLIANDTNAKMLMLTHFWPEIDKQKYVDEAKETCRCCDVIAAEEGKVYQIGGKNDKSYK